MEDVSARLVLSRLKARFCRIVRRKRHEEHGGIVPNKYCPARDMRQISNLSSPQNCRIHDDEKSKICAGISVGKECQTYLDKSIITHCCVFREPRGVNCRKIVEGLL